MDNRTSTTRITIMLEAVSAEWYDVWTLEQIKWVEKRYYALSTVTRQRKQELTSIPNLDSPINPKLYPAYSPDVLVEPQPQTQQFQDNKFQTPLQHPATAKPLFPIFNPTQSPFVYQPHHQLIYEYQLIAMRKVSMHMNPSIHMRTITSPITINRPLLGSLI